MSLIDQGSSDSTATVGSPSLYNAPLSFPCTSHSGVHGNMQHMTHPVRNVALCAEAYCPCRCAAFTITSFPGCAAFWAAQAPFRHLPAPVSLKALRSAVACVALTVDGHPVQHHLSLQCVPPQTTALRHIPDQVCRLDGLMPTPEPDGCLRPVVIRLNARINGTVSQRIPDR